MAISPSSIIHFTNKKESLIGILTNNFKLSYCKEKIIILIVIYKNITGRSILDIV